MSNAPFSNSQPPGLQDESRAAQRAPAPGAVSDPRPAQQITCAEQAPAEASEIYYRTLVEALPQLVWTANPDGYTDFFNRRWYDYTGLTAEDCLGWGWEAVLHPDDVQQTVERWMEAVRTGVSYEIEYRLRRGADGAYRWHLGRGLPLRNQADQIVKWLGTCTDIDDQKRAEEALRESKERWNAVVRATSDAIWDWDLLTGQVTWNETASTLFGYTLDVMQIDKHWWRNCIHPDDRERISSGLDAAIRDGAQSWAAEYRFRRADGSYAYVFDRGYVIYNQAGQPVRMIGAIDDLSTRKQAEALANGQKHALEMIALGKPLAEILEALAVLIEAQSEGMLCAVLLLDEMGQFLRYGAAPSIPAGFKHAYERVPVGLNKGSCGTAAFLQQPVIAVDIATDPRWTDFRDVTLAYGLRASWSTPIMSSAGEVLGTFSIYYREPHAPDPFEFHLIEIATHICGIAIERTRTQEALQHALQRLTFHVENTPLGMIEWDQDYRVMRWSPAAVKIFGWQPDEVLGKQPHDWQFVYREDIETVNNAIAHMLDGSKRHTVMLHRNYTKNGRVIHCVWYSSALLDSAGQLVSVLSLIEDVTARLRAEEALRFVAEASALLTSSLEYEETLATLGQLIVPKLADWCTIDILDERGSLQNLVVVHANPAKIQWANELQERYPAHPDTPRGKWHVLRTGQPELFSEMSDEMLVKAAHDEEHLRLLREVGFTSYICVPLIARKRTFGVITLISAESGRRYDDDDLALAGHLARRAASAVDNSRLYREAQEAIIARDEFLSIASHELKTPLTPLRLQTQSLIRSAKQRGLHAISDDRLVAKLALIDEQAERLARLANDLLDVTRIRSGKIEFRLERVDFAQTVRDVALRFEEQCEAAGCRVLLHIAGPVWVNADRLRLEQVVTNLLSNAIKYGGGQPIEILVAEDTTSARLTVRDYGIGIAPEHLERIFARFERAVSSRNYGGLGLGLYIARQIIDALGGAIDVASELGVGSTFVVTLPRAITTYSNTVDQASAASHHQAKE
ncbi:MAG TPA: PAS domain S-box protein [Herpetosiphonaceae bacterium]